MMNLSPINTTQIDFKNQFEIACLLCKLTAKAYKDKQVIICGTTYALKEIETQLWADVLGYSEGLEVEVYYQLVTWKREGLESTDTFWVLLYENLVNT